MSNSYFNFTTGRMVAGENALAEDVNSGFDAVSAGFDKLPTPDATKFLAGAHETTSGSSGNFVLAVTADSYFDGMAVSFKANHSNSGACTLNVGSLGAKPLVDGNGSALAVGDIVANSIYAARYNSTSDKFHLVGLSSGNAADAAVVAANISDVATIADNIDELLLVDDNALAAAGSASEASGYADDALTQAGLASGYADAASASAANLPNATTAGADKVVVSNTAGDGWEYPAITAAGKALLDDADAAAQRATLGFPSDALTISRKNLLINGGFDVWQRGSSITQGSPVSITSDRWRVVNQGYSSMCPSTASRRGVMVGESGGLFAARYVHRLSVQPILAVTIKLSQRIEDLIKFVGKTVTLSFYAKASVNTIVQPYFRYNYDDYPESYTNGEDVTAPNAHEQIITTSWARYSATVELPATVSSSLVADRNSLEVILLFLPDTVRYVEIANAQLEFGDTATDFEYRHPAEELMLCQRYYEAGGASAPKIASLLSDNMTRTGAIHYKVTKRRAPSISVGALTAIGHDGTPGAFHTTYTNADEFVAEWYWTGGTVGRAFSTQFTWTADAEL